MGSLWEWLSGIFGVTLVILTPVDMMSVSFSVPTCSTCSHLSNSGISLRKLPKQGFLCVRACLCGKSVCNLLTHLLQTFLMTICFSPFCSGFHQFSRKINSKHCYNVVAHFFLVKEHMVNELTHCLCYRHEWHWTEVCYYFQNIQNNDSSLV